MALNFGHDLVDADTFQPAVPVTGVIASAGSIEAEEAGKPVEAQLPLQDREGVPFEFFVAHGFEWDHRHGVPAEVWGANR